MNSKASNNYEKNKTWALWTANGRPMDPQSLQNVVRGTAKLPKMDSRTIKGELWGPQISQNGPLNCQNEALKDTQSFKITANNDDQANIE